MTAEPLAPPRRLRCALFVDFDNVYIGLQRLDAAAAEEFASSPARWLAALESGSDVDGDFARRFLVRACYLNPARFAQFRPNFTRAGFSVVDCPSLTQQGKSSADINLVLDAVDALAAPTFYDEFVLLSADADFTPLAHRFRAADRRVTIVTASPAASAYRAVADTVVTADELAELVKPQAAAPPAAPPDRAVPPTAPVPSASVAPQTSRPAAPPAVSPARRAVLRLVRGAERPVEGGVVGQAAQAADPGLRTSSWDGHGGLFPWLAAVVPEVGASNRPAPGYVWDPRRFSQADLPDPEAVDLPPLQRQVVEVADVPNLPRERYHALLTTLAADVATTTFDRALTIRRVYEACQAAGHQIGRASVTAVVSGVLYAGLDLNTKPSPKRIAETWAEYVVGLCQGARMELGAADVAAIRIWLSGGLLKR